MPLFNKNSDTNVDSPYSKSGPVEFQPGDVFYSDTDQKYHLNKVLAVDKDFGTLHVMIYPPLDELPEADQIATMLPQVYHAPIAIDGFTNPRLLAKTTLQDDDLVGYMEYIRETRNAPEIFKYANKYYQDGYRLTDEQRYDDAIRQYTRAIEVMPAFFEALDNRAFVKMDQARWEDAIADFKLSLEIEPNALRSTFSIGECYLKMKDFARAKDYFEQSLVINPAHELSRRFLEKTVALMAM